MNKLVDFSKEDKNDIPTFLQLLWDYISSPTRVVGMVIFNNNFTQKSEKNVINPSRVNNITIQNNPEKFGFLFL